MSLAMVFDPVIFAKVAAWVDTNPQIYPAHIMVRQMVVKCDDDDIKRRFVQVTQGDDDTFFCTEDDRLGAEYGWTNEENSQFMKVNA